MASHVKLCSRGPCLYSIIAIVLNFLAVTEQLDTTTTSTASRRSTTTEIDHFDRDYPANVTVILSTPYNISASWSLPNHSDQKDLENFIFCYYQTKYANVSNRHHQVTLNKNVTTYVMNPLKPGTAYTFKVIANYSLGHQPHSVIYTSKTEGYGEDRPCQCNHVGTKRGTWHHCHPVSGQCTCNDKHTLGQKCDSCQKGYIWSDITGCLICSCDSKRSFGNCSIDKMNGTSKCNCRENYGGFRCLFCAPNFYVVGEKCVPCHCNKNTKPGLRACNYMSGVCLDCQYNTTGDQCEKCLEGYSGDAIIAKNCTSYDDIPSMRVKDDSSFREVLHHNMGAIVGACAAVLALVVLVVAVIVYRHWWRWRRRPLQFWTVQLKEDRERVSFSADHPTYQHVDGGGGSGAGGGLLPDDVCFYDGGGWRGGDQKTATNGVGRSSRPRTYAGGDGSNPYRSLEET